MAAAGKTVLSLTGDGGFNMMLGEIETARRVGLTFTVIVVNNAGVRLCERTATLGLWCRFLSRL